MKRLSGLDASFLYMETPESPMHVAGTYLYDPSTMPGGYSFERIRDLVESRLHVLPPYRQRLVEIPFQLHHPLWIEDPDFDLDYHLRRAALPAPGGRKELEELAAAVHARPLDRRRPLWEMYVIEGLEDGNIAVIAKTHHSAIDGASGVDITVNMLDTEPEPAKIPPPDKPWKPDRIPTDGELVGYALSSLARQPVSAVKAIRRTVEAGLTLRQRNRQPDVTPPPAPFSAPRTSLNGPITGHRSFSFGEVSLDDVKSIRKAFGGTVNDVILAICAGGLRAYFDDLDEHPSGPLVAMVPISVRGTQTEGAMGNQVSSMLVSLATDVDDPIERLRLIQGSTRNSKEQANTIGAETLTNWAEFAAPAIANQAARLYARTRVQSRLRPIFNVTISNVPGPQFPLYFAGQKLLAWWPMSIVTSGQGLNMTVMSYTGTVYLGLTACPDLVADVGKINLHICSALQDLKKLAEKATDGSQPPPKKAPKVEEAVLDLTDAVATS